MRVRASENPPEAGFGAEEASSSAFTPVHTRVIPEETDIRPPSASDKIRNFASLHTGATQAAAATSWFGRERPPALFDACRDVVPGDDFTGNWLALTAATFAGMLRLGGLSAAYLAAFCFATRIRAAVSTAVLLAGIGTQALIP